MIVALSVRYAARALTQTLSQWERAAGLMGDVRKLKFALQTIRKLKFALQTN